jgi:thiamine-monophosphate kinase
LRGDRAAQDHLVGRYRVPQPRNALAEAVRDHATAAMDVSDGLAGDLAKLCAASAVGATIEAARVPLSSAAGAALSAVGIATLVSGGDDYEILCTVPEARCAAFLEAAAATCIPVTLIGTVIDGPGPPRLLDADGRDIPLQRLSYSHF